MVQGVAILPESAHIVTDDWIGDLTIKDHKIVQNYGLFFWMRRIVYYGKWFGSSLPAPDPVFTKMKDQGIEWYGAAEYMANEIEYDVEFDWAQFWVINEYVTLKEFKKLTETDLFQEIKKDVIYAIRHCDSYEAFAEKFGRGSKFLVALGEKAQCR